jgi:protein SCO1
MAAVLRSLAALALAATLAACAPQGPSFRMSDITGSAVGRDFALTDHAGKPRALADFRGKIVVMFFGYVHCPDVCPTTLLTVARALNELGPESDRVQVLFVTIDPERDTPELLRAYVPLFDPRFLGLYGDAEATERVAKEFKVIYRKNPGQTPETYSMDHSAGLFVFDPKGRLRLYGSYGDLLDGPLGRALRVRPEGPAAPLRQLRAGRRRDRARPARAAARVAAVAGRRGHPRREAGGQAGLRSISSIL